MKPRVGLDAILHLHDVADSRGGLGRESPSEQRRRLQRQLEQKLNEVKALSERLEQLGGGATVQRPKSRLVRWLRRLSFMAAE
ncbi:MAG: hypothetical protein FJW40_01005 [Acidobacteria bacterium]|nr:hypothetical protein [Acidobacteriota bacterium]